MDRGGQLITEAVGPWNEAVGPWDEAVGPRDEAVGTRDEGTMWKHGALSLYLLRCPYGT